MKWNIIEGAMMCNVHGWRSARYMFVDGWRSARYVFVDGWQQNLFKSRKIFASFWELTLFHAFTNVPGQFQIMLWIILYLFLSLLCFPANTPTKFQVIFPEAFIIKMPIKIFLDIPMDECPLSVHQVKFVIESWPRCLQHLKIFENITLLFFLCLYIRCLHWQLSTPLLISIYHLDHEHLNRSRVW